MRVADKIVYNQVTSNLQKNRSDMNELQNQASTQKRINKLSDDPVAAARVLAARTDTNSSTQFIKNINVAKSFLEFSEESLGELTETLMRAKELAVQMANDAGAGAESRRVTSGEVAQLYNQAVQVANRKLGDRFIFSGYKTNQIPFNLKGEYSGDDGDMRLQTNKDAFVSINISGEKVFLGKNLSDIGMIKDSSEMPRSVEELKSFKQQDQLDEQGIQNMEQGEVLLRAPASVGPGKHNESRPEANESGINIFQTLKSFEVALKTNDKEEIQNSIDSLDRALSQVVNSRSQLGARVSALNATSDSLHKAIVDNKSAASQLEDADLFQVVSDINKTDSTLRASLETSSKVMNTSLLDFLK